MTGLSLCIDWLTLTGQKPVDLPSVPVAVERERGRLEEVKAFDGWSKTWRSPDGLVVADSVCHRMFRLTGGLCAEVQAELFPWLKIMHRAGWGASRLDAALDDRSGLLDVEAFKVASMNHSYTPQHVFSPREDMDGGVSLGQSLTWGKRGTEGKRVCVYDKRREQKLDASTGDWERLEVSYQGESACSAMKHLVYHGVDGLRDLVLSGIDFREPGDGHQELSRRPRCAFWQKVVETVGGNVVKIQGRKRRTAIETCVNNLRRSVWPQLSALLKQEPAFLEWFLEELAESAPRAKRRHEVLAKSFPAFLEQWYGSQNSGSSRVQSVSIHGRENGRTEERRADDNGIASAQCTGEGDD